MQARSVQRKKGMLPQSAFDKDAFQHGERNKAEKKKDFRKLPNHLKKKKKKKVKYKLLP